LLVIPTKARNKEGAYQLINYLMEPEVAGANTNFNYYANPILTSTPYIEPQLLKDPGLYPPQSVFRRLVAQPPLSVNVEEEIGRIWGKLRSAQSTPDEPALSEITEKFPLKPKQENALP
jgi:putrescine transport system substrate-binding protein